MRPLGVALDTTPLLAPRTGVGEMCAGVLGALAEREDVEVLAYAVTWRRRGLLPPELPPGVRALGRPLPARPLHLAWRWTGHPAFETLAGRRDVVHGTNFVVPPARRAVRVVTVHDLTAVRFPELCEPATLRFPGLVRRAVREGAWVHVPSEWVAGEVCDLLGAPRERVRAVHHGIPGIAASTPAVTAPPLLAGLLPPGVGRYVLAVGTVEPRKDLPGLVRAFDALAAERPDLWLVLAGGNGWGTAALDAAVGAAACRARIARLGYVSAAARDALIAGAAIFAYPSLYEGFGFPPLEAMARGVPVVATTAGALPEVLGDGASLVAPRDHEALAGALAGMLDDEDARAKRVAGGRRRAAQFSWELCAAGLTTLYRDALA